jgi:hypothetical protein
MKGTWTGFYKYDNPIHQRATGFEQTYFTIKIDSIEEGQFTGNVWDDIETGGMEGTGEITGSINESKINFVKQMPTEMLLYPDGERVTTNNKHKPIYYIGKLVKDKYGNQW